MQSIPELKKISKDINKICFTSNFKAASRLITRYYTQCLVEAGVTSTQFSLLITLMTCSGCFVSNKELSNLLSLERTSLARGLENLFEYGFVNCAESKEGDSPRGKKGQLRSFTITPLGMDVVERAIPLWRRAQKMVNEVIEDSEKNAKTGEYPIAISRLRLIIEGVDALIVKENEFQPVGKRTKVKVMDNGNDDE